MNIRLLKNNNAIELVLLLLCPFLSLLCSIHGVYKGKLNNLWIISVVMSFAAFISPPFADLYRHTLDYLHFMKYEYDGYIFFGTSFDFVLYSLSHLFAKYNIPFEYVRAIFVFITYQCSFFIYRTILKQNNFSTNSIEGVCLFWIFFLTVPFIWIVNGLRMATACYLAAVGYIFFEQKKYYIGVEFFIFSLCFHFGSLLFFPVFLYSIFPLIKINKKSFLIISVLALGVGALMFQFLPDSVIQNLNMEKQVDLYVNKSQENFADTMSFNGLIAMYLERITLWGVLFCMLLGISCVEHLYASKIYAYFVFLFLLLPFTILYQKFSLFIIPVILFLFFRSIQGERVYKWFVILGIITTFSYMYGYRKPLLATPYYKLLTTPIYMFVNANTKETLNEASVLK